MLNSIFQQTFLLSEIIIIDDGKLDENYAIKLIYYKKDYTKERNRQNLEILELIYPIMK